MENPWEKEKLKEITYLDKDGKETVGHIASCDDIASCDEGAIDLSKKTLLQFKYLPQPYMGDPEQAEIFLLNGNPDAKNKHGILSHKKFNEKYKEAILESLDDPEKKEREYPLYALNREYIGYYISYWWRGLLHSLIENEDTLTEEEEKVEKIFQNISKKIFAAELFPYFSNNKKDIYESIPILKPKKCETQYLKSQKYTFDLIEKAIDNNKMIIIMRFEDEWYKAVKGLKKYSKKIFKDKDKKNKEYIRVSVLNSYRNPQLSRTQMTPDISKHPERKLSEGNFDRILKILKGETL